MSVEVRGSERGRVGTAYTLTCTVTLSHRVRDSSVSIQWQGPSTDDHPTVDSTDNRVITRQLSLDPLTLAHGGNYTCTAVYRVNGEDIITNSDSKTFTIPGINRCSLSVATYTFSFLSVEPVDPVRPENITFMDVKSDSVIIQWTVLYISYSPETYVVQYGTSRDSLIHNSSSTHSEEEVMTYSVELSGLRDNTTYYVQVLATNTAQRSNRSTVHTFTTLPLQSGIALLLSVEVIYTRGTQVSVRVLRV